MSELETTKDAPRRTHRRWLAVGALALCAASVTGCGGFRAERNGKQAGEAICDLRNADDAEDAQEALDDANNALDDAARITGRPVNEDIQDIEENLRDLNEHAAEDQSGLARQDIAVIRRNVQSVIDVTTSRTQRFYQGLDQGLSDCID